MLTGAPIVTTFFREEDFSTRAPHVHFRVLGAVEILNGDQSVSLKASRQQTVLAMLLLEANRVVAIDQLIDALWGDDPPTTARSQVQICVSALRRVLADIGAPDLIATRAPGYLIRIPQDQLDMLMFERMVTEASVDARAGHLEEATAALRQALALWSGPALAGVSGRSVQGKAARLEEIRLGAYEDCTGWELQLGRHHELISELTDGVSQYPLRERLLGQLMVALYRSGRQAEALEIYRNARKELIDQLGIEPGEELRRLESAILAHDDDLELPMNDTNSGNHNNPRQLVRDTGDFTGRQTYVASMTRMLTADQDMSRWDGSVPVIVVAGKTGVGKSALSVHVAHKVTQSHFPDGQLYADLGGTQSNPVPPEELLTRFLRTLGVPGSAIPRSAEERAALYRSRLAGRRVLIVLDDAADEAQVRPLLPGSSGCAVLITSRSRLTGIPGNHLVALSEFNRPEAVELLGRIIGTDRVRADPAAADTLVSLVGCLPLALRVAGARLAAHPHWTLATMVRRLANEGRRLDELAHGEQAVRASISLTYNTLPPMVRKLFRVLSDLPLVTFPSWVGAAVLDIDVPEAEELIDHLVNAQLLDFAVTGTSRSISYRFHALIRIFAWEKLQEDPPEEQNAALERVCGGWLALAEHAHGRFYGGQYTLLHGNAARWQPPSGFRETPMSDPLGWLESERPNLTATVLHSANAGLSELSWDLAMTLVTLFETRSYFDDWADTHKFALAAAQERDNHRGVAAMLASLGSLHVTWRKTATATDLLNRSMTLFTELGDHHGQALVLRSMASLDYHMGATARAMERYASALAGLRQVGDHIGVAHVLLNIAQFLLDSNRMSEATDKLHEALAICREAGSLRTEAQVLNRLGHALLGQDDIDAAHEAFTSVLRLVRSSGDRMGEGYAYLGLGTVYVKRGDLARAEALQRSTLEICEEVADTVGQARAAYELGQVLLMSGKPAAARQTLTAALTTFRDHNLGLWEDRVERLLARLPE